jgi:hypothetical protein
VELFGEVFSVQAMPRLYSQEHCDYETALRWELVLRQLPASKDMNMEPTALKAITR